LNLGVTGIEKSRVGELILKCTRLFLVKMQGIITFWFNNLALVWSEKPVNLYLATLLPHLPHPKLSHNEKWSFGDFRLANCLQQRFAIAT
jgi:hypothetical protein